MEAREAERGAPDDDGGGQPERPPAAARPSSLLRRLREAEGLRDGEEEASERPVAAARPSSLSVRRASHAKAAGAARAPDLLRSRRERCAPPPGSGRAGAPAGSSNGGGGVPGSRIRVFLNFLDFYFPVQVA